MRCPPIPINRFYRRLGRLFGTHEIPVKTRRSASGHWHGEPAPGEPALDQFAEHGVADRTVNPFAQNDCRSPRAILVAERLRQV